MWIKEYHLPLDQTVQVLIIYLIFSWPVFLLINNQYLSISTSSDWNIIFICSEIVNRFTKTQRFCQVAILTFFFFYIQGQERALVKKITTSLSSLPSPFSLSPQCFSFHSLDALIPLIGPCFSESLTVLLFNPERETPIQYISTYIWNF